MLLGAVFLYLSGLAAKWFGLAAPSLAGAAELEVAILAVFLIAILVRRVFAHPAPPSFSMNGNTILGVLYVSWLLGFILKIFFTASLTSDIEEAPVASITGFFFLEIF